MEHLNRIQIRGTVGAIRLSNIGGRAVANFSVCTEHFTKLPDGAVINETTWHQVVCWQSESSFNLIGLYRGQNVYVEGRVRHMKYTNTVGEEKVFSEIIASKLESVKDE